MDGTEMRRISSFPPVAGPMSRALILGSMPSVRSLEEGFYYAHPRNAFWPIIASIAGEPLPRDIGAKRALILRRGLALWDTAASCERVGSLDSAMKNVALNDVAGLLKACPKIELVLLNGGEAYRLFMKMQLKGIKALRMPSTSPAYTLPYADKLSAWREALQDIVKGAVRP